MKAFVFTDPHGCLDELKELLKDIDRTKTRIICAGDLIDRGKDSEGVIKFIRDNNIECVKGNHELMAEECIPFIKNNKQRALQSSDWFYNGGDKVYYSYSSRHQLLEDLEWLAQLPLYIETGIKDKEGLELLVSHTWTSMRLEHAKVSEFNFVWDRAQPTDIKNNSKYYNIFGHTPVDYVNQHKYHKGTEITPEPEYSDGCCNIDTGCAYPTRGRGYLTGIFFPSFKVKQVKLKG